MRSLRCGIAAALFLSTLAFAGDAKVELGRRLFMDPTVSRGGRFSCASCHDPERGFSDARPLSEDENGKTRRHSQPLLDLRESQPLHWDGEFGSVRELLTARLGTFAQGLEVARNSRTRQFEAATTAGREPDAQEFQRTISRLTPPYYGGPDSSRNRPVPVPILLRLREDHRYAAAFSAAYGTSEITTDRIIDALHAFSLTLKSGENALDRYLAGDPDALSAAERRGLALFTGKADCASCHSIEGNRPALTDDAFHNTGVTFGSAALGFGGGVDLDGGAGHMSFVASDLGKFKTPSLRDVARRPPYMHDGSFATLEEVVRYYDRGGTANRHLDEHVRPLSLSDREVRDLVAFLEALTGDERPGLGPARKAHRAHVRILDLRGGPMRDFAVEIRPAGDRLEDGRREPPQVVRTDAKGYLSFDFPAWTHVRLVSPTHEIHYDWLIPDSVTHLSVMAAPRDKVALKLRKTDGLPATLEAVTPMGGLVSRFRRVRMIDSVTAVYAAERRVLPGPFLAQFEGSNGVREFDLSGGWTEPLDVRPE
jgi:cytochrome c peroxidase